MARSYEFTPLTDTLKGVSASSTGGRKLPYVWECWVTPDPGGSDAGVATGPEVIDAIGSVLGVYLGVPHPDYPACLCTDLDADVDEKVLLRWVLKGQFVEPKPVPGTIPGGSPDRPSSQTQNPEPEDRPPSFKVLYQRIPFSSEKDRTGKAFKNPAGDWFENAPQRTEGITVLQVKKWYAYDDWDVFSSASYQDNTNAVSWVTPFGTCAQYKAKIEGLEAELKTEAGRIFWEVTFTIHCKTPGLEAWRYWHPVRVLNIGRNVLDATGNKVPARDSKAGQSLSGQVLLKADGTRLPDGDDPTYTEFDLAARVNFHDEFGI